MPDSLKKLFYDARGAVPGKRPGVTRGKLAELAAALPGAPDLDDLALLKVETSVNPPADGRALRYFAAAAGIHVIDIYKALEYWPPVGWDEDPIAGFKALCEALGLPITSQIGNRFVVEVPKK